MALLVLRLKRQFSEKNIMVKNISNKHYNQLYINFFKEMWVSCKISLIIFHLEIMNLWRDGQAWVVSFSWVRLNISFLIYHYVEMPNAENKSDLEAWSSYRQFSKSLYDHQGRGGCDPPCLTHTQNTNNSVWSTENTPKLWHSQRSWSHMRLQDLVSMETKCLLRPI